LSPIIGDRHERERKSVRVKRNDQAFPLKYERVCAGHPTQAAVQFVLRVAAKLIEPCFRSLPVCLGNLCSPQRLLLLRGIPEDSLLELRSGRDVQDLVELPTWGPVPEIIRCAPVLHESSVPFIGQNGWPKQPKPALRIDKHSAVGVRIAG